jgi:hypothetical protein
VREAQEARSLAPRTCSLPAMPKAVVYTGREEEFRGDKEVTEIA